MKVCARILSLFLLITILGIGCASPQSPPTVQSPAPQEQAMSAQQQWQLYSDAIRVAVEAYESDVLYVTSLDMQSEAEAHAVVFSHGTSRLHGYMNASLRRRGLSSEDLLEYCDEHPEFVEEQQNLYVLRLERLSNSLEELMTSYDQPAETSPTVEQAQLNLSLNTP